MLPVSQPLSGRDILKKIWFLFIAVYFIIMMLDFTSSDEIFPHFVYSVLHFYTGFWDWMVPWTGRHILHLSYPITVKPNGSGDTTYNYVLQLLWIIFSLIIAVLWAMAPMKRSTYDQFRYWLRILVRYYLAYILFTYGFIKIIKLQFPSPDLMRLTETYGESSPMGLAWTFVGYSKGYNLFIGGTEVLAGILLFFKRTALLGSLIAMTIMANVAAMNFAYDIPVKLFSVNLVIMAGWISWYDIDRLVNLFFLNNTAIPSQYGMPVKTRWKKTLQASLKILAILFALYSTLWSSITASKRYGDEAPKPPLYGIYDVQTFVKKGDTLPPLTTDTIRWKRMIINYPGNVRITTMADSSIWMALALDTIRKTARFTSYDDSTYTFIFRYKEPGNEQLIFSGSIKDDSIRIEMKRFDINKFNLVKRGYNWINEYPYNE